VPYAVVLGIAAGLLEFVPLAGPLTVGALAATLAVFHSGGQVAAVILFLLVCARFRITSSIPRSWASAPI
jgi:predicted PurR-regulated permease PerM